MQDVDRVGYFGDIDHAVCVTILPDAYLPDAGANCGHRFPVIRFQPLLNLVELESGLLSGASREIPYIPETASCKLDWFHRFQIISKKVSNVAGLILKLQMTGLRSVTHIWPTLYGGCFRARQGRPVEGRNLLFDMGLARKQYVSNQEL